MHAELPACPAGPLWLPGGCPHLACVPGWAAHSLHVLWTQASSCMGVASIFILNLASYSAQSRAHMVGFVSGFQRLEELWVGGEDFQGAQESEKGSCGPWRLQSWR